MANLKLQQIDLGTRVRGLLSEHGFKSVAADGFQSPGVVVCYTDDPDIKSGKKFAEAGIQIAAGVPLECDEPADFQSFRIGLFGVEKLQNVDRTIELFDKALSSFA
jgi:aspartate aminotransferase-like enzyme